jgi:hypothetical protein
MCIPGKVINTFHTGTEKNFTYFTYICNCDGRIQVDDRRQGEYFCVKEKLA